MARKHGGQQWSAIGAARAARECKASVIQFLANSPVPARLQAGDMDTAFRALRRLHGRRRAAAVVLQKCGLSLDKVPDTAPDWLEPAGQVIQREVEVLRAAPLYVMAPSMCDVTAAAAQTLTIPDIALIDERDPPTPDGLLLLPHALATNDGTGTAHVRALSWCTEHAWYRDDTAPDGAALRPQLRLSVYDDLRHYSDEDAAFLTDRVRREGHEIAPILLRYVSTLPFHGDVPDAAEHQRLTDALHAASAEKAREVLGDDLAETLAEYTPGTELPDPDHNLAFRLSYAFFRLVDQRIAAAEPAPVTHSATVIAQRAGTTPDVRVIQLRTRTRRDADADGQHTVDWSHRWVVQMHKVRQWYPSEQQNKIILRGPYVKGPTDKPFICGDVVRAVTR